jgi:hypothetical protein
LDAFGEIGVVGVAAKIFKRQDCDAFFWRRRNCWRNFCVKALEKQACNDEQQDRDD